MEWAVSFLLSWDQDFVRAVLIPSPSLLFLSQSDVHLKELREKWVELLGYRTRRFRVWTPLFYSLTTSICVKCQLAEMFFFSCHISRGLGGEVRTERIYLSLFFFCFHVSLSLTHIHTRTDTCFCRKREAKTKMNDWSVLATGLRMFSWREKAAYSLKLVGLGTRLWRVLACGAGLWYLHTE